MDGDKGRNDKNDQPAEGQESADEKQPEYREISKEELEQIFELHKKWLESDKEEGKQCYIFRTKLQQDYHFIANLQEARFVESNLQKVNLMGANLQKADLFETNLQQAYLMGVNLQKAILTKANLQETALDDVKGLSTAKLKYANFEGATGLLGNEFAQADVTGTKLPDGIKDFKALEIVKETSQNARKIFFAMLLGCVYSWLTIATTTDVRLLTNSASSPLPIIGTEIPIAWFYIAAPLVLICIYFYFHLYLIKLWEALSGLPAIFPDGKRLDERAYPWLLNGLVRRHFKLLKKDRPFIAHVQEWITIFLSWWVVPITMMAFWLRFIPSHDWFGTLFHIILIVVSVAFAIIFYRLCVLKLKSKIIDIVTIKRFQYDKRPILGTCVLLVGMIFLLFSYGAIEGVRIEEKQKYTNIQETVLWAFKLVGFDVFANFREKGVSEKPIDYWQIKIEERLDSVKGANLKGKNLNKANMSYAFLEKADFRKATLIKADLEGANLQEANLGWANLQKANLGSANLQEANLGWANLQEANLGSANLQEAYLGSANLKKADLRTADIKKADLGSAKLQEANLWSAKLQEADLRSANLQKANLGSANLKKADLRTADIKKADLGSANLQEADLRVADLWWADLGSAKLQEADLRWADLGSTNLKKANLAGANFQEAVFIDARNLTIGQLTEVKTLYKAKLDTDLMEQVINCCPHLLEKPKEVKDKTD